MKMAAGPWTPMRSRPEPGRSYLICGTYGGMQTCDVAFYNGTRADGSHWWMLGNVEIAPAAIDRYAEILLEEIDQTHPSPSLHSSRV
ncbi:hypothetical protein ACFSOZ_19080 [Mesorhizobium newzealandense]|uniref:Uncharacterized protein n=1 Tax=Mesorhizobium newzealandense TaxID=1300302 RepID=A0ABW4UDQ7_9HYPH|nr:hypothetical protein [Mesorhizobium sophorae]